MGKKLLDFFTEKLNVETCLRGPKSLRGPEEVNDGGKNGKDLKINI